MVLMEAAIKTQRRSFLGLTFGLSQVVVVTREYKNHVRISVVMRITSKYESDYP